MKKVLLLCISAFVLLTGCRKDHYKPGGAYKPDISPDEFSSGTVITNPYFPAPPGKKYTYEGETAEGSEKVVEQRLAETKVIMGISCIVVNFKAFVDDELIEEAWDWYAQDNDGNVWYFGEAVDNYEEGVLINHDGSWEAGIDGAQPGIIMPAHPYVGLQYREEYYPGEAEDEAAVIATGLNVTIPFGSFDNCIQTKNWTDLEPGIVEFKFYAPGVGLVKELNQQENEEIVLVEIE
jgi:hypothetical protein